MSSKEKPLYLWARTDYWIHEAFGNEHSSVYRVVNDIIVFLIFFSIISIMLSSVDTIYTTYQSLFDISEWVVVTIFTIEYAANIYVAPVKTKYIFGPWGAIDFLAIAPSYFSIGDFRAIKVLRVLRILRFLRLMRMLRLLKLAKHVIKTTEGETTTNKFETLKMDLTIYFIALFSVLTIFSTLEFYCEKGVEGTAFTSIPKAMWWCIVTITTVGYGDMYPVTTLGRITAGFAMLCGLALFGLLMNVIGKYMMTSLFGSEIGTEVNVAELEEGVKKTSSQK
ncbi:ion transporter [Patescibacteria group bacterium]|nr:ion transporter [Patescibacteria group bacterium]MBU1016191.1 ion transporter [Patescibacteria group bacterium]MBU1684692.1 ion transporter [Patescibacteria group bacterium]MBU1938943.1 ion transporter [Patescibacteria group bacterium]